MFPIHPQAVLALEDGSVFIGQSIGIAGSTQGEVVFNTSMTGYQEMLTDPSYCGQILTFTYPHIGNYGTNAEDVQSYKVQAAGLIIKDLPLIASNFRSQADLQSYLQLNQIVAIADIDTRKLTRLLRTKGAQNGCILALPLGESITDATIAQAIATAKAVPSLVGQDLAKVVSTKDVYQWAQQSWTLADGFSNNATDEDDFHVVAIDFGVKHNILCLLVDRGCKVTVVPAQTSAEQILALKPDGVFLSNGPGDPQPCDYAISCIQQLLAKKIPLFGICLGHQLLSIACGAKSFKMKFGHHGGNHPVKDLQTGKVCITSQNHGFAVDVDSLPAELEVSHISLFDGTVQGVVHKQLPAFSFQGHPEAAPGPNDINYIFDNFIQLMEEHKNA